MKKLNYIMPKTLIENQLIGVKKKVDAQINVFNKNNIDVNVIDISIKKNSLIHKIIKRLPFTSMFGEWTILQNIEYCDVIYIRYIGSDYGLIKNLRKVKSKYKKSKIIIEIPTYPYEDEIEKNLLNLPVILKDRINRKKLFKYVDRIATYSDDEYIFGIKTINLSNGVDLKEIKPRINKQNVGINIIAVATFANWHGYDRFIKGLGEYYKNDGNEFIKLHLVGDGEEVENYKKIVKQYDIYENVIFHGRKSGEELDEIYNECDIALDSMGRHRNGILYNSSLKGKEYMAKGMPIISGVKTELDQYKEFKYYKRVSADESSIDMESVIMFYKSIYENKEKDKIIKEIRFLAEELFDIEKCLEPIMESCKK